MSIPPTIVKYVSDHLMIDIKIHIAVFKSKLCE